MELSEVVDNRSSSNRSREESLDSLCWSRMEVDEALLKRSSDSFRPSKGIFEEPTNVVLGEPLTSKVAFALLPDDKFLTSKVAFPGDAFLTLNLEFGLLTSNVAFTSSFRKVALKGESSLETRNVYEYTG